MPIPTIIVDDHHFTRQGLGQAIQADHRLELVGEACSGTEALQLAIRLRPELVITDLHLPDLSGIEISLRLMGSTPSPKIVILSADADRKHVDAALQAGVIGYLLKNGAPHELRQALDSILAGRLYLSPDLTAQVLESYRSKLSDPVPPSKPGLSLREQAVLQLVAEGLRSKEIASRLKIRAKTADTYRSRVMKKLGCSNTAEMVRRALHDGLVQ